MVYKMKRLFIAYLSIFIILLSTLLNVVSVQASSVEGDGSWPEGPNVFAESAIVMEASTGLILYEKNIDEVHYPASITKIMTALLAIENSNMGEIVTFSKKAIFDVDLDSSRIGIDVGEQLTMQQALYGILLESANEVSYAVAEHVAGSAEEFAKMMTERAKSLGCKNTNFTNPHGLHDENHYTNSYDMALITREAMKNDTFRKIFATRTYQIPPTNIQSETRYLRNHHRFILRQDYRYDDCIGGKTGYTSKSKFTLVSVAKRGDLELICVVMRDDSNAHQYTDTQNLFDFAFDNYSIYPIADLESPQALSESPMFTRYNPLLSEISSPIATDEKGYLILPNSASFEDAKKEVTFYPASEQKTTPQNRTIVGKISYTYNGKYVGGADILYHNDSLLQLKHAEKVKNNPTTAPEEIASTPKADKSLRPIILGGIVGLFVLIIILYFVLIEAPRLRRRNAYYKKRARRKAYRDDDFLDL
jgi:serine-type D-Ala-D-Ala carboxypeptidase (penicillin-binding protein 5/6)